MPSPELRGTLLYMRTICSCLLICTLTLTTVLPCSAGLTSENSTHSEKDRFEQLGMAAVLGAQDPVLQSNKKRVRKRFSALFLAIATSRLSRAKQFTPKGTALNAIDTKTGATPLTWAAQTAQPELVAWLLDLGADPEAPDGQSYTPLTTAARHGKKEIVRLLLTHGANPNGTTPLGVRPLQLACGKKGSLALAQMLVQSGANPHLADKNGWTPLSTAVKNGRTKLVAYLLKLGAHPDGAPVSDYSPLHWAATENRVAAAALLLQGGAQVNPHGPKGETPLSWCGSKKLQTLLKQAGAVSGE